MDPDLIPGPKGLGPCFLEGPKARESPSPIFGNVPENMSFLFNKIWRPVMALLSKLKPSQLILSIAKLEKSSKTLKDKI